MIFLHSLPNYFFENFSSIWYLFSTYFLNYLQISAPSPESDRNAKFQVLSPSNKFSTVKNFLYTCCKHFRNHIIIWRSNPNTNISKIPFYPNCTIWHTLPKTPPYINPTSQTWPNFKIISLFVHTTWNGSNFSTFGTLIFRFSTNPLACLFVTSSTTAIPNFRL